MPLKLFICQRVRLSSGPIRKQFIPGKSRFDKIFEYIVISGGDDYLLPVYLSYINIQPYYVYLHDMVSGAEEFRTTLGSVIELEIELRRSTAGLIYLMMEANDWYLRSRLMIVIPVSVHFDILIQSVNSVLS